MINSNFAVNDSYETESVYFKSFDECDLPVQRMDLLDSNFFFTLTGLSMLSGGKAAP